MFFATPMKNGRTVVCCEKFGLNIPQDGVPGDSFRFALFFVLQRP